MRRRPVTLKLVHTIVVALLFSTMAAADVQQQPRDEEMQTGTLVPCLHSVGTGSVDTNRKKAFKARLQGTKHRDPRLPPLLQARVLMQLGPASTPLAVAVVTNRPWRVTHDA